LSGKPEAGEPPTGAGDAADLVTGRHFRLQSGAMVDQGLRNAHYFKTATTHHDREVIMPSITYITGDTERVVDADDGNAAFDLKAYSNPTTTPKSTG